MTNPYHLATAGTGSSFWMPEPASSYAEDVDRLFYFILTVCVAMMVLITAWMVYFVWRYHHKKHAEPVKTPTHSTAMELTWTIGPIIVVMIIFYYGFRTYLDMSTAPANAYEIQVTAYKWGWAFTYPNGHVDENLHVPLNRPVRLVLNSQDVIHSLYIPAFRIKKDLVPGRYNETWFEATKEGEYVLLCAEYCGTMHSDMVAKVIVKDASVFAAWLEKASDWVETMAPKDAGERVYTARGCAQCHSVDGSAGIGPTFQNLFGSQRPMRDGSQVLADENYIRQSILEPGNQIVAGYDNVMPTYQGRLKDVEINAVIAFMKSISENYTGDTLEDTEESAEEARYGAGEEAADESNTDPGPDDGESAADADAGETDDRSDGGGS